MIASYVQQEIICSIPNAAPESHVQVPSCALSPYEQLLACDALKQSTTCHIHCQYDGKTPSLQIVINIHGISHLLHS